MTKIFIIYPCGKKFEIRIPFTINDNGKNITILPGDPNYLLHAQKKFQINNLKVVEEEVNIPDKTPTANDFISLVKKKCAVE